MVEDARDREGEGDVNREGDVKRVSFAASLQTTFAMSGIRRG
jgi:hypothetical protein